MKEKKFRVAEIFGPTIQGEGRNVGMPCHFVRLGGCDFRCSWCDTPHAVLPELVALLPQMTAWEIVRRVVDLGIEDQNIRWVVITGGNPGLYDLNHMIDLFHKNEYKVMLETQGSTYRNWFNKIDDLCISPKPPSSGNITDLDLLDRILERMWVDASIALEVEDNVSRETWMVSKVYLKVPVFGGADLEYAREVHRRFKDFEMFISIGNMDPELPTVGHPEPQKIWKEGFEKASTRDMVLNHFLDTLQVIFERYPDLQDCRIFPQQHVLLWGNERGH